jgi:colicin import membrane protein
MKYVVTIIVGFVVLAAIGAASSSGEDTSTTQAAKAAPAETVTKAPKPDPDKQAEVERLLEELRKEGEAKREAEAAEPTMTSSQENAIESAQSYVDMSGFSKEGLIEQLQFEKFSKADAQFAVDHIDVNWNAEAVESAEGYLDMSGFSKPELIDQLEFEGFTPAQAAHGVSQAY